MSDPIHAGNYFDDLIGGIVALNRYIDLMQKAVNYIEESIDENITLSRISKEFHVSEFHFDRLFHGIVGISLKKYVLGRKLTLAIEQLDQTGDAIIDIAMNMGFEYPEVFSRAFKKQFGMSPRTYRAHKPAIVGVRKADIVPREILNCMGNVTLKADYTFLESMELEGVATDVDITEESYGDLLKRASDGFITQTQNSAYLDHDSFYSVVNCHGDVDDKYTVFSGKRIISEPSESVFQRRVLPGGWYAGFNYHGDIVEMRSTFTEDLLKWIVIKEVELRQNGVGMLTIVDKDYLFNQKVHILIPIHSPK